MNKNLEIQIAKPFGPSIAKVKIPDELVLKLNDYVDDVIKDENKSKSQDFGGKLIGQVTQEFRLDKNFYESSGWLEFLGKCVSAWIQKSNGSSVKTFTILDTWVVRQFKNEYNPAHWHSGHVSGVGYLKVPKNFGSMPNKTKNPNDPPAKLIMSLTNHSAKPRKSKIIRKFFFGNFIKSFIRFSLLISNTIL